MTFFVEEYPDLEEQLQQHFSGVRESLTEELCENIACLALGGGYGRGEGGVLVKSDGSEHLFNDLDYFCFCNEPDDPALRAWITEIETTWSEILQIDVEIEALPPGFLASCSHSMMANDLVAGHHIVYGPDDYISRFASQLNPESFATIEATRLLWNRGSGLFFARCRIEQEREAEYIHRNHQKLKLALGDAYLCMLGQYDGSAVERGKRVAEQTDERFTPEIKRLHAEGVTFKLHPRPCPLDYQGLAEENAALTRQWAQVFLAVESRRLDLPFNSLENYATFSGKIGKEYPWWKPPLLALRDFKRYRTCMRPIWEYPRFNLHRVLACLNDIDGYPRPLSTVARFMKHPDAAEPDFVQWEPIYERWWSRYS